MNTAAEPDRRPLEDEIRAAFRGVKLGKGISLSQAEVIDRYGKDREGRQVSDRQFDDLKFADERNDWTKLELSDLERDNIAHMDGEGLRFYLPALMLSVISNYVPSSMRVIGTLSALDPRPMSSYHLDRYSFLDDDQKHVIARYIQILPDLVSLDYEDAVILEHAMAAYWHEFLIPTPRNKTV